MVALSSEIMEKVAMVCLSSLKILPTYNSTPSEISFKNESKIKTFQTNKIWEDLLLENGYWKKEGI